MQGWRLAPIREVTELMLPSMGKHLPGWEDVKTIGFADLEEVSFSPNATFFSSKMA